MESVRFLCQLPVQHSRVKRHLHLSSTARNHLLRYIRCGKPSICILQPSFPGWRCSILLGFPLLCKVLREWFQIQDPEERSVQSDRKDRQILHRRKDARWSMPHPFHGWLHWQPKGSNLCECSKQSGHPLHRHCRCTLDCNEPDQLPFRGNRWSTASGRCREHPYQKGPVHPCGKHQTYRHAVWLPCVLQ